MKNGPGRTLATELRPLIPEILRRWQERSARRGPRPSPVRTSALRAFLEQLAEALASDIRAAAHPLPVLEEADLSLDRLLAEYHLLHRALVETLEAEAALPGELRTLVEDVFHEAERQTARSYVEREAQRSCEVTRQLRALVESDIVGVTRVSLDGRILDANDAFLDMVGYTRDELIAGEVRWPELTPPEFRALDERCVEEVKTTGRCALFEKAYLRKDGTRVSVLVGMALADPQRGICATYVLDRTRYKELEIALRERAEELSRANARMSQFLAMIAHELRTPLSTLTNALYVLENLPLPENAVRQVTRASRQTRHAARLVSDLMDLSRITRGKLELRPEPISLRRIAADVVESARPLLDSHGHEVTTTYVSDPLLTEADPTRIEQIISNLLTNAAKYTEPGGHISVSLQRAGDSAVLRVRDTGIGIDPAKLPHVFNLYEQFGLSEARSEGGLGIGLSLVKRLVELHGGAVTARSEGPGKGSEFEVVFPLRPPA